MIRSTCGGKGTDSGTVFRALADDTRRQIIEILAAHDICAGALARRLGISEAAVSQQLKVLREAGLVDARRFGYFQHYAVNSEALVDLSAYLGSLGAMQRVRCDPVAEHCDRGVDPGCGRRAEPVPEAERNDHMIVASTYDSATGEVFQHFGRTENFKFYTIENGAVKSSEIVSGEGIQHEGLINILVKRHVDTLICGGIGGGARMAMADSGIKLLPGVTGSADRAAADLAKGQLQFDPDAQCHHDDGHCDGHHHE